MCLFKPYSSYFFCPTDVTSVNELCDGNESHNEVTIPKSRKKRVSFGGQLSPELFDKCLPPNSPLRRGATPRHSLGLSQKNQSLLRRASTIGLMVMHKTAFLAL